MPMPLRACVALPAIVALAVLFFLIGALAWVLNTIAGPLTVAAEWLWDALLATKRWGLG